MYTVKQFDSLAQLEHYLNVFMIASSQELIHFSPVDIGHEIHYICIFKTGK